MTTDHQIRWLGRVNRLKRGLIVAGAWTCAVIAAHATPWGKTLDHQVTTRLEFDVRDNLHKSPPIHERLKIFGYDDRAVAEFQRPELSMDDWAALIDALARQKPKAIFIDKMFTFVPPTETNAVTKLKRSLERSGVVNVGAFVHNSLIPYRDTLALTRPEFSLDAMTGNRLSAGEWLPRRSPNVYGPHDSVAGSFARIGHLLATVYGRIDPVIRVNENTAVPHLALFAGDRIQVQEGGLRLGSMTIPLDDEGRVVVDFPSRETLFSSTFSLMPALKAAHSGSPIKQVAEGDTVLILPLLYTGNHDYTDSPVGTIPGGFVLAALLNSIVSDRWLVPVEARPALTAILAMVGAALGYLASPLIFWSMLIVLAAACIGAGLMLFAHVGLILPWFPAVVALFGSGLSTFAVSTITQGREATRLRNSLKDAIPEAKLKDLLSGQGTLTREPAERVVTLMFLDIANFSVVAQQSTPKDIFLRLKSLLREVTKTIHKYGGTVAKTLGDGILCFFGYSYDGETTENQADVAIRCAAEIQRDNVRRCIDSAQKGEPVLPFRIGLNTGAVYIGDLGNEDRIDFTVIGNGVNYAQRLEAACEHHSVMVSATTIDFSTEFNARQPGFTKRFIHVKHHEELLEAIEMDPLHDTPKVRSEALQEYRRSMSLERKELRWPVDQPDLLTVDTGLGAASLVDFSTSGCAVRLKSYLAKGVVFTLDLRSAKEDLARRFREKGVASLRVEVRWGKTSDQGYVHGVKYLNLSENQLATLHELLRETFARSKDTEARVS